jgi:MFS family permease
MSTVSPEVAKLRSIAFLNLAHAIDHFVLLIFPTIVIGLEVVFQRPYAEMIALSTAAFVAFGLFSLPAGWLADRWSRRNMMAAFYFGCGISLAGAALAPTPFLTFITSGIAVQLIAQLYARGGFDLVLSAIALTGFTMLTAVYMMAFVVNGAESASRSAQPAE